MSSIANPSAAVLRKPVLAGEKTAPTNSTAKLRTRKKHGARSPKSLWKTLVSIFMNFSLLAVPLLLALMVHRLALNQGSGFYSIHIRNSDYERGIAEVEVVDRNIYDEIADLKADFSDRFRELDGRLTTMEKSLTSNWLSKDEFNKFLEEFKGKKGVYDISELKLDEVRAFTREIVEKEIGKHAADGLGRVDYAVASGGATVLKHSEPFISANRPSRWIAGNVRSDAVKMLQPSFGQPGECFPLKGDKGFVEIKLMTAIIPEAITVEHVSKSVAFDRSSAPKDCKVFGWLGQEEGTEEKKQLLTELTYDLEKSNAQTFKVVDKKSTLMDTIRLEFVSNQGSLSHTCIYRVRVHGHELHLT